MCENTWIIWQKMNMTLLMKNMCIAIKSVNMLVMRVIIKITIIAFQMTIINKTKIYCFPLKKEQLNYILIHLTSDGNRAITKDYLKQKSMMIVVKKLAPIIWKDLNGP